MVIGIDARFLGKAGPGRYVRNILRELEELDQENDYLVFVRKGFEDFYWPRKPNFRTIIANYQWYSFSEQFSFLILLLKSKLDLFYVPHFNIPVLYPGRLVCAIPDLIMHEYSTEDASTLPKFYYRFKKLIYFLVVFICVIRSFKVIVSSNETLKDFLRYYSFVKRDKFVVAYEGVDPELIRSRPSNSVNVLDKFGIKKPFLLYVSSMYKHKNVENLIRMFEVLLTKYKYEGSLVLIGKDDYYSKSIKKLVEEKGFESKIIMPGNRGFVSDADIVSLRYEASAYVFPTLKEGFSLTPLEAMSVGLPCALSGIPCHLEIYKDAAIYFDPKDPEDMASKVELVLKDGSLRSSLTQRGFELVKMYNWVDTAKVTLRVFQNAVKNI